MKDKILKLRSEGKTYNEIQRQVKCSKSTIAYYCSPNGKENNRIRTNKERRKNRNELKTSYGGKCNVCGYNRCLTSLVFHHRTPDTKEGNVSYLLHSRGKEDAYHEAKKCVLICANCHGEFHEGLITI